MGTVDGNVIGHTKVADNGDATYRWNLVILGDGYQIAQLNQFHHDVENVAAAIQLTPPYDELWGGINIYRIDVVSTDSGAVDPVACGGTGANPKTYFDASFGNNGIRRLLQVNDSIVHNVVNAELPQAHMIVVIVNSTVYGGSGGSVATFSLAPDAEEIALHEMGHTAFGLADEYESYAGCGVDPPGTHDHYVGLEPGQPNITMNWDRDTNKWHDLVLEATPMPTTSNADCSQCDTQPDPHPATTVGTYAGAATTTAACIDHSSFVGCAHWAIRTALPARGPSSKSSGHICQAEVPSSFRSGPRRLRNAGWHGGQFATDRSRAGLPANLTDEPGTLHVPTSHNTATIFS